MIIKQIVNNNVVISENENDELVVVGKGIGFHGRVGQPIDGSRIEKTYVLQTDEQHSNFKMLLEEIPYDVIKFGIKAANYIERCANRKINKRILIPLTDHICSCLERYEKGVKFNKSLALNVSVLYRDEYKIATDIVDMLNSDFNVDVDRDEAGFITLHIVYAESDIRLEDTYTAADIINIAISTVEDHFNIKLDNSINYARFVTHLQYFAERMVKNTFEEDDLDLEINKHINLRYPNEYACAKEIGRKIEEKYGWTVENNEYTYLTIHIARLLR